MYLLSYVNFIDPMLSARDILDNKLEHYLNSLIYMDFSLSHKAINIESSDIDDFK
jgi:hypothetical protein